MYHTVAFARPFVVVAHVGLVSAFERRTGALAWQFRLPRPNSRARTTIAGERVIVTDPGSVRFTVHADYEG